MTFMSWMAATTRNQITLATAIRQLAHHGAKRMMAKPSQEISLVLLGFFALASLVLVILSAQFNLTIAGIDAGSVAIAVALIGMIGLIGVNQNFDAIISACAVPAAAKHSSDMGAMAARLAVIETANVELLKKLNEVTAHRDHLEGQMLIDTLTGAQNRRGLDAAFKAHGENTVFAMLDLDHFKNINDTLGHDVGDRVLKDFASLLAARLGDQTPVYRIGGEEFIVLFPDAQMADVANMLGDFRNDLQNRTFTRTGDAVKVSFSAGLAMRTDATEGFDDLYQQADARLYEAKTTGRAKTCYGEMITFSAAA